MKKRLDAGEPNPRMTEERVAKLEALGFDWSPKRTALHGTNEVGLEVMRAQLATLKTMIGSWEATISSWEAMTGSSEEDEMGASSGDEEWSGSSEVEEESASPSVLPPGIAAALCDVIECQDLLLKEPDPSCAACKVTNDAASF